LSQTLADGYVRIHGYFCEVLRFLGEGIEYKIKYCGLLPQNHRKSAKSSLHFQFLSAVPVQQYLAQKHVSLVQAIAAADFFIATKLHFKCLSTPIGSQKQRRVCPKITLS
jgi:hypothetical protein